MASRVDEILGLIDNALADDPDEALPYGYDFCIREGCDEPAVVRLGAFCVECREYMLGDVENDPVHTRYQRRMAEAEEGSEPQERERARRQTIRSVNTQVVIHDEPRPLTHPRYVGSSWQPTSGQIEQLRRILTEVQERKRRRG